MKKKLLDWWDQFECALSSLMILFTFAALLICVVSFPIIVGYMLVVGTVSEKLFALVMLVGLWVVMRRLSKL